LGGGSETLEAGKWKVIGRGGGEYRSHAGLLRLLDEPDPGEVEGGLEEEEEGGL